MICCKKFLFCGKTWLALRKQCFHFVDRHGSFCGNKGSIWTSTWFFVSQHCWWFVRRAQIVLLETNCGKTRRQFCRIINFAGAEALRGWQKFDFVEAEGSHSRGKFPVLRHVSKLPLCGNQILDLWYCLLEPWHRRTPISMYGSHSFPSLADKSHCGSPCQLWLKRNQ